MVTSVKLSSDPIQILDWDSDFFRFPVANLDVIGDTTNLKSAMESVKRQKIKLTYITVPAEYESIAKTAEQLGALYINRTRTYSLQIVSNANLPSDSYSPVEQYKSRIPEQWLIDLAIRAGHHSRFKVDPKIPSALFQAMYTTWIRNFCLGRMGESVFVPSTNPHSGFIALTAGCKAISLFAVDEAFVGKKIGTTLVRHAIAKSIKQHADELTVKTQDTNVAACRFYESCGFSLKSEEIVLHFWNEI